MTWRIQSSNEPGLLILDVIQCQQAWRLMSARQREALVLAAANGGRLGEQVHPRTRRAMHAHGLVDHAGKLTQAAELVLKYRPRPEAVTG